MTKRRTSRQSQRDDVVLSVCGVGSSRGSSLTFGNTMITLSACFVLTVTIAATMRLLGTSKKVAVGSASLPMLALLVWLASTEGLDLGLHGGISSPWLTVALGLFAAYLPAQIVVLLVKKKGRREDSPGLMQ